MLVYFAMDSRESKAEYVGTFFPLANMETTKSQATQLPCGLFILKGVNNRGLATLTVWKPKAKNPHYAYCFTTPEKRDAAIEEQVQRMENWQKIKEKAKQERKGKKTRTSVIKTALGKKYPDLSFSVVKGKGTASGWIEIGVEVPRPTACSCGGAYPRCAPCRDTAEHLHLEIEREVSSSLEAEGMELSYYCSDDGFGSDRAELLIHIDFPRPKNPCCFCGKDFGQHGNNAEPLRSGRCCDDCNLSKVVPSRLKQLTSK